MIILYYTFGIGVEMLVTNKRFYFVDIMFVLHQKSYGKSTGTSINYIILLLKLILQILYLTM